MTYRLKAQVDTPGPKPIGSLGTESLSRVAVDTELCPWFHLAAVNYFTPNRANTTNWHEKRGVYNTRELTIAE